jgi:rubrerythrin
MATASSRREVLAASAALAGGGGAALLASCGGGGSKGETTQTVDMVQRRGDAAIAGTLLELEAAAIVAYGAIGARLDGRALAVAREFAAHERAHAAALRRAIAKLGERPPAPRPAADYSAGFPPLPDAGAALRFALDVESTAIAAYADALGKVATDSLRVTLASVLATESEHASVLLGRLGRPRVPAAFVTGPVQG